MRRTPRTRVQNMNTLNDKLSTSGTFKQLVGRVCVFVAAFEAHVAAVLQHRPNHCSGHASPNPAPWLIKLWHASWIINRLECIETGYDSWTYSSTLHAWIVTVTHRCKDQLNTGICDASCCDFWLVVRCGSRISSAPTTTCRLNVLAVPPLAPGYSA